MATKNSIIVMSMAAFLLLTGCGNNTAAEAVGTVASQVNDDGNVLGQQRGQSPRMAADLLGKIKSINGQSITLYKSSFVPGARGGDGGGGNQQPPSGAQDGRDEQTPSGNAAVEGQQPPQGDGQARSNMANMFSDETVDIQVTSSTKFVKTTFENQEMKETALEIADLKEGDIVSIDLEDNTQNATTVTLNEGGFGGMGGMGGGQGQEDAPSASSTAGN